MFAKLDVAAPGFINMTISGTSLLSALKEILRRKEKYGASDHGKKKKVLIEFVSANPTGPLHVGHGRWAAIGDAIASLLTAIGYKVDREFYINDVGKQIDLLVRSVQARAKSEEVPEGGYGGSYILDVANELCGRL